MTTFLRIVLTAICVFGLAGCATFKTLDDSDIPLARRIFIYSGTRLDWAAFTQNDSTLRKFDTEPPDYPLLDMPLSFALDSLFLPLSLSAEIFH